MITDNLPRLTAAFAPLLALLTAAPSLSQEARWFKVELMVFSQETQARSTEEQWAPFPELAYPEQARFLIEPARIQANLREYGGVSRIDQLGRQIIDLQARPEDSQDIPYRGGDRAGGPGGSPDTDATAGAADSAAPEGFVVLPAAELEFAGKTAYMQRNGPYRILFHQAWLQPVPDEPDALPIIVDRSGDTEQWPRLQGSIKLHLSRYLHLETNLWLNTAGDYLPGQWRMPAPPLAPPSLIVEGLEPEEEDPYFLTPADEAAPPGAGEETLEEPADAYPFRHAVLLRQKRRMRSEEVHYLDHPLLGAVVKVTPYEWDAGEGELPPAFPGSGADL